MTCLKCGKPTTELRCPACGFDFYKARRVVSLGPLRIQVRKQTTPAYRVPRDEQRIRREMHEARRGVKGRYDAVRIDYEVERCLNEERGVKREEHEAGERQRQENHKAKRGVKTRGPQAGKRSTSQSRPLSVHEAMRGVPTRYHGPSITPPYTGFHLWEYENGIYEGEYIDGMWHGKGTFRYNSGESYTGDWYAGKRHGMGVFVRNDGRTFWQTYQHGELLFEHEKI